MSKEIKVSKLSKFMAKPTKILFQKTLFYDLIKFPKLLISIILMTIFPIIAILSYQKEEMSGILEESLNSSLGMTYNLYAICIVFPIILTVLGAPLIAEEMRSRTMIFLVSKPLSRGEILLMKYLALTSFGILLNFLSVSVVSIIALLFFSVEDVINFFLINLIFAFLIQIFFQSIVFCLSCFFKKTRIVVLIPVLIIIIILVVNIAYRFILMITYPDDSSVPAYIQYQLYHYDAGYHLFNIYVMIVRLISGSISESLESILYSFGLYRDSDGNIIFNDFYSPLGSLIWLSSIITSILILGFLYYKKRDISR